MNYLGRLDWLGDGVQISGTVHKTSSARKIDIKPSAEPQMRICHKNVEDQDSGAASVGIDRSCYLKRRKQIIA